MKYLQFMLILKGDAPMKKRPTLYLQRTANVAKPGQANKTKRSISSELNKASILESKSPKINLLKPFLHKEPSKGLYLYLGKKIKIFLGGL